MEQPTYEYQEFEETNNEHEGLDEEILIGNDDEVQATKEVESSNFNVEELEKRLAPGEIVENEFIAYALYCKYAKAKGFGVRKGKEEKYSDGSGIRTKLFYCRCEGAKDQKSSINRIPDYQKRTFRCGCLAKLKISRRKGSVWKVAQFHTEHNHILCKPDETYLLRSNRKLSDEEEIFLASMVKSKIPISKAIAFLENVAHGRENIGFTIKDAYDRMGRLKRKTKMDIGDAAELIRYFISKSNKESDFYWNVEVDDDGRLMNFFFRDFRCLKDYECFGDVVSVDTTYNTNKHGLKCSPFVGINHHHENVMFGIAFLSDESESSFEWLFRTFLESVGGKQPETIFTDQCQAMMNAIDTTFPHSHHRLCQWHIGQNAPSHFGSLNNDSIFLKLWGQCMNYCASEEEFESTWKKMIDEYNVGEINWFNIMYKLRHRWATVFSKNIFSAGLLATSRSEGTNTALKKSIGNCTSSLMDCVNGCQKVLGDWRLKEKEKDIICCHNEPTPFARINPLLKHAAAVYTFSSFQLFEKEFKDTMCYEPPQVFQYDGSALVTYMVKAYGSSKVRFVECDTQEIKIKCSCCEYESSGLLCRHALKVMDVLNMQVLPENCIKKRWTKEAKNGICFEKSCNEFEGIEGRGKNTYTYEMSFVNQSTKDIRELAIKGKAHTETRSIITKHIESANEELDAWFESMVLTDPIACDASVSSKTNIVLEDVLVLDPLAAKSKGITNVNMRH